jgi:hypothetical protein
MKLATRYFDRLPQPEQALFRRLASPKLGFPHVPESLIDGFARAIEESKSGYQLGLDDYRNELTAREIIQEIIDEATPDSFPSLQGQLDELDDLFRAATVKLAEPIFASDDATTDPHKFFYYWRVPRNPGQQMLEELLRSKYIKYPSEVEG